MTFLVTKLGLDHLSLIVYGHSDVEEDKRILEEILEKIHMVIFLVMLLFIAQTVYMMILEKDESQKWRQKEGFVITYHQRQALLAQYRLARAPTWCEWLLSFFRKSPCQPKDGSLEDFQDGFKQHELRELDYYEISSLVNFMLQRQKFLFDGDGELDKAPDAKTILDYGFSYSLYIRKMLATRLASMLELPTLQWLILWLFACVVLLSSLGAHGCWEFVLWLWFALGLVLFAILFAFMRYLKGIMHSLAFDLDPSKTELLDNRSENRKREIAIMHKQAREYRALRASLSRSVSSVLEDESTEDEPPVLQGKSPSLELRQRSQSLDSRPDVDEHSHLWIQGVPRYYEQHGVESLFENEKGIAKTIEIKESCVPKCLKGRTDNWETKQGRHKMMYNLLLFGMNEVTFHLCLLRFMFLSVATFQAVFFIQIGPSYLWKAYDPLPAALISIACTAPGGLIFHYMYAAVAQSVLSTAGDVFRSDRHVASVVRYHKEYRAVLMLRLFTSMRLHEQYEWTQRDGEWYSEGHTPAMTDKIRDLWEDAASDVASSLEVEQLMHIFDLFDVDGNRSLSHDEASEVMHKFGLAKTGDKASALQHRMKHEIAEIAQVNHRKLDLSSEDAAITRLDFLNWMIVKVVEAQLVDVDKITEQFWKDNNDYNDLSGKHLSIEELSKGLNKCLGDDVITFEELSWLMVELDVNDDGEFSRKEFKRWIMRRSDPLPIQCSDFIPFKSFFLSCCKKCKNSGKGSGNNSSVN